MGGWKLWFVLVLLPTLHITSKGTVQHIAKTIGSKADITPVCGNETHTTIVLVLCKIRTERNPGEECYLRYRLGTGFINKYASRFTLRTENQTVVLHLTSLTPLDSGNYTCECSHVDGTHFLHLNITVKGEEEDEDTSSTMVPIRWVLIGTALVVITAGVILGFIHKTNRNRQRSSPTTSGLSVRVTRSKLDEAGPDETYTSLQQPASDLYQSISNPARNTETVRSDNQRKGGREADPSCTEYENI